MVAYIFDKYSFEIESKITNVTSVKSGEINGDSLSRFGSGSDYIILQLDTINLNKYDTINLTGLEDCRDYFLLGKDAWYMKQMNRLNETHEDLKTINQRLECYSVDLQFQLDMANL